MTLQTLGKLASIALGCLSAVVTILAYLAPRLYYHHTVALIAVVPAIPGQAASVPIDGPSVYIGIFGSCARASNALPFDCVSHFPTARYNLSVLPNNLPNELIPPSYFAPLCIAAFVFWLVGLVGLFASTIFVTEKLGNTKVQGSRAANILLPLGFIIWVVMWVWFGTTAHDFNACVTFLGGGAPDLYAEIGFTFVLMVMAYAFVALIFILTHAKEWY